MNMENGQLATIGHGNAMARTAETAGTAAAAHAQALVQARYIVALQRPRDWMTVRARLLAACERPAFAETAIYAKPVGGKAIEGLSIRAAEEAARAMGNVDISTPVIYDDESKRIVNCSVTDLESNTTYSIDITIEKTVERRKLKEGQQALGTRQNSYGDTVYIVPATDDDILNKQNSLASKAIRTGIFRVLPSDIREEIIARVRKTMDDGDRKDPNAARNRVVDGFVKLKVMPEALKQYLGHEVATCTPEEIAELRTIGIAIRDGETTWAEVMKAKYPEPPATDPHAPGASAPAAEQPKGRAAKAKAAVNAATSAPAPTPHDPKTGEVIDDDGTLTPEEEARMAADLAAREKGGAQ